MVRVALSTLVVSPGKLIDPVSVKSTVSVVAGPELLLQLVVVLQLIPPVPVQLTTAWAAAIEITDEAAADSKNAICRLDGMSPPTGCCKNAQRFQKRVYTPKRASQARNWAGDLLLIPREALSNTTALD